MLIRISENDVIAINKIIKYFTGFFKISALD